MIVPLQPIKPEIPDHELLRIIGTGSYGEVWLARSILGVYRAVKIVRRSAFSDSRPFDREFNGLKRFEPISRKHDSLMDILHVGRNDELEYIYCVMELGDDVITGQRIEPDTTTSRHSPASWSGTEHFRLTSACGLALPSAPVCARCTPAGSFIAISSRPISFL